MGAGVLEPRFDPPGHTVTLVAHGIAADTSTVEIVDPEGLPLAELSVEGRSDGHVWGSVRLLGRPEYGPFRRLFLSPDAVKQQYPRHTAVPVPGPLTLDDLEKLRKLDGPVLLLALVGDGTPQGLSPVGLLRATCVAAALLDDAAVVAVPLASRGEAEVDHAFGERVVAAYAPADVVGVTGEGALPHEVAEVVAQDRPTPDRQGFVVFFTGLSGSGKSTLARALRDRVLESGERTVTSLDGDVVRRNLSAGLTFSAADRETNIRRIGWVAAEIARHRGMAICSPIAPFAGTRGEVRSTVERAGGAFFLVHVATPLEECERRDRKGLYAKARRGEISEFTGISSPYEAPTDADVRVDTTGRTIQDTLDDVLAVLYDDGYLKPADGVPS